MDGLGRWSTSGEVGSLHLGSRNIVRQVGGDAKKKEDEVNRQLVVGLEGLARGGRGTGTSDAERSEFRALQQPPSYPTGTQLERAGCGGQLYCQRPVACLAFARIRRLTSILVGEHADTCGGLRLVCPLVGAKTKSRRHRSPNHFAYGVSSSTASWLPLIHLCTNTRTALQEILGVPPADRCKLQHARR